MFRLYETTMEMMKMVNTNFKVEGRNIQKLGAGDTPKICASVKGQNWGSTTLMYVMHTKQEYGELLCKAIDFHDSPSYYIA